ncbi:UNVERIFIED_CONTAM: LEAF RUST 10 DISEASE-RESISTANCE LOCUS RECEPTOR-LIKE PROTEIN KINASE-like 2.1 [Sesamum angustifolium]|uniref:LEAF RUST 10 DISEASE-RESISTANCE LOCUS RECEPTOR-LIKE PROTEIN KINASE-like 2.1 n=1 Tax=Sesamum angustifolium TaxID=2727405 RepID=A0AAW2RMN8_9LAMI
MHTKPSQVLFLTLLALATLLPLPGSYSQQDMCSDSFQCANITNITYPFWGGSQPQACGLRGFQLLNCDGHFPLLYISPLMYRVLEFDFSNQTLKVARQDLLGDACPTTVYNTTLQDPYHFAPDSNDLNITLFFDCFIDKNGKRTKIVNQFGCSILFGAGDASSSPGPNITCSHNISVPVNQTAMQALENRYGSDVLREAVARGFFINYISRPERAAAPSPVYQEGPRGIPTAQSRDLHPTPLRRFNATEIIGKSVVLVALTICTASVIICCCLLKRRLAARRNPNNERVEKFLLQHGSLALKRYKCSEIKKMTKSFNDKLGRGGYGSVYQGVLPDGCPVAVKILIDSDSDSNGEEFINEVASISRTSHVNIVNLLGFCYGGDKRALVYEFMPNKSLDKFISNNGDCQLDWEKLYKIAVGVAKGLEYLHTGCNIRIVHFDIKPQNILLDDASAQKSLISGSPNCARRSKVYYQCLGQEALLAILLRKYSPGIMEEFLISPTSTATG